MTQEAQDQWAQWLLHRRFGGDLQQLNAMLEILSPWRDRILQNAKVSEGEIVLDVGCGDGLIAFGALDHVGVHGKVIFSDISQDLLKHSHKLAQQMQVLDRCQFIQASADDLSPIESNSVDVVTTRSVLIYVREKQQAFREFYRVLKTNGRLSIFEPINRFAYPEPPYLFFGYEVAPTIMPVMQKLRSKYEHLQAAQIDPMVNFDERDLLILAEDAGFPELHLELHASIVPGTVEKIAADKQSRWENMLKSSPNPLVPTLKEVIQRALTTEEAEQLEIYLRPLVEKNQRIERSAVALLWAVKR